MSSKRCVLVVVLLALIAALLLSACTPAATEAPAKAIRVAVVMPSSITDMAFSQSMWMRLKAVQTEMGGEAAMEIKYSENMFKVPDAAAAIRDYASQGFDIVIAHGSQYGSSVAGNRQGFPQDDLCLGHGRQHLRPGQCVCLHRRR